MSSLRNSKVQQQESYQRPHVQCAYDGCFECATISKKAGTAIVKLCRSHYEREHLIEVKRTLDRMGLNTKEQKRAYRDKCVKGMSSKSIDKEWANVAIEKFDFHGYEYPLKLACIVAGVDPGYWIKKK